MPDFKTIHDSAYSNEDKLVQFLRDIVAIPSLSGQEEDVVKRIAKEMEQLDYDEIIIDPLGNVMGRIG
ncbi:YgeY family selenium metabolism-linked hydrolase, partial [bacterium]|nr:YgeY family selenium metabolism-linked hydrolase [bacterium]